MSHCDFLRVVGLLSAAAMLSFNGCAEEAPRIKLTPVALESEPTAEEIGWRLTGVGSCTASGCHGNSKPHELLGSEYNIWISADPHAQAHSTLYSDESLEMVQKLDGDRFDSAVPPYEDRRCLTCHSTTFASAVDEAGQVVTDGVGCEACHGPAEGWLAEHYLPGFSVADRERLGMWDTKDLYSRGQICASCHVGSPGREVNHDLIAAGHPRLQFEMGAYLQALPKHWDERKDRARFDGNYEFLAWVLGQTAASRAAIKQLEHRAARGPIWPELSEWSCGACHHDLLDETYRQDRAAAAGLLSGQTIRWDDWNHHLVREHAGLIASALGKGGGADSLQQELAKLAQSAGSLKANRHEVATNARVVSEELDTWAKQIQTTPVDLNSIDSLMNSFVQTYQRGVGDVGEAMLVYDALATLQQARLDTLTLKQQKPDTVDQGVTANLARMFELLTKKNTTSGTELVRRQQMTAQMEELAQLLSQRKVSE
jgi:hypothetical protein